MRSLSARPVRTVGVEEELLLVDAETHCPVPIAEEIFRARRGTGDISFAVPPNAEEAGVLLEPEVKHEQIEVVSPPLRTYDELLRTITTGRRAADDAARLRGARAVPLATSVLSCTPHPVSQARYDRMRDRFGLTFDEQLTCGFHIHVGVESPEEGVAVLDRIRPWLPVILALSANSPFWQGQDTHYASYRYQAWGRWPSAGPYELFGTPMTYFETVHQLLATDVPLDSGMIYFDARLSAHAPTVETRIADICLRPEDAACMAVLVRALVETAARQWHAGAAPDPLSVTLLRAASWRASRFGVDGMLVHPLTGKTCPARMVLEALMEHVRDACTDTDEAHRVDLQIKEILRRGSGAREQRHARTRSGTLDGAVEAALGAALPVAAKTS